jgi:hypothetical protein
MNKNRTLFVHSKQYSKYNGRASAVGDNLQSVLSFSIMAPISLPMANFLALVLETLLYGAFTVLFVVALWVITVQRSVINWKLLITVVAIWLVSTTHLILDVVRAVDAFVTGPPGGALAYYLDLSNPLQAVKTAIYVLLTLVGDGFVIYRCYIVYNRKWWIALPPFLLLCGTGIGGFGATVAFSKAAPGAEVFLPAIVPWITSFIALTLATNVVCTCAIAWKINSIQQGLKGSSVYRSAGQSAVIIIIESAAIYSCSIISLMITYQLGSNAQYTVLDLTAPLIGITFTIIILRVSLGISSRQLSTMTPGAMGSGGMRTNNRRESLHLSRRPEQVKVNVSHFVEVDGTSDHSIDHKSSNAGIV